MTEVPLGERLVRLRLAAGLTQEQLAERSAVSVGAIRKIERAERDNCALSTLRKLAAGLGVETASLFSPAPRLESPPDQADRDDLYAIRRVLQPARGLGDPDNDADPASTVHAVAELLTTANHRYRRQDYAGALRMLPQLITEARTATLTDTSPDAWRVLARTCTLAANLLVQVNKGDLAYLAVAAAIDAGNRAGDDVLVADAVNAEAWLLLRQARFGEAETVASRTAEHIEPSFTRSPKEQIAMFGWLHLRVAAAAVRNNHTDTARDAMQLADAASSRLGEGWSHGSYRMPLTPAVVATKHVEQLIVIGHPDEALRVAHTVPSDGITGETRSRHLLDVTSALLMLRRRGEAADTLIDLRHSAPAWLRHQPYARSLATELLAKRARALTPELRDLAGFLAVEA